MRGFDKIAIDIVISKNGAAYRRYANGFFSDTHFIHYFCDQTMRDAVCTARAVMGRRVR